MSFGSDSTPMPCTWHQASDQNEALLEPGEANMRRIIGNSLVSADGVVPDDPVGMGFADYYDDTYLRERLALFTMCDAILWGRTTYEVFSKMWPRWTAETRQFMDRSKPAIFRAAETGEFYFGPSSVRKSGCT